ncbi:response regulator [Microvirga calopogonii]|uniref:response regulator n=1 Tax=Microvirga calopogonii TaxID=2078013 RepID=UPI000E0DA31C|nr:response regulator [Microvirga calopogonii]
MSSSATGSLSNCRVLVVEDEFYLADDMTLALQKLGAEVVGPVPTKDKALALLASGEAIDAAILDINLKGQAVYPVADALAERGVPFVFATGYAQAEVPAEYRAIPLWEKPFEPQDLAQALPSVLRAR